MLSKHQVDTPMSGFLAVKRGFVSGLPAHVARGIATLSSSATASGSYGQAAIGQVLAVGPMPVPSSVPEIAVGAGISAFVLAGGGLLLLADRLRGKKKSKS